MAHVPAAQVERKHAHLNIRLGVAQRHAGRSPDGSGSCWDVKPCVCLFCRAAAGQIVDNDLNQWMVNPLGPGVRLHAVIDACHSGSALDLEFRCGCSAAVGSEVGSCVEFAGTGWLQEPANLSASTSASMQLVCRRLLHVMVLPPCAATSRQNAPVIALLPIAWCSAESSTERSGFVAGVSTWTQPV